MQIVKFLDGLRQPENVYRKPVILQIGEQDGIVAAHFDLKNNDPKSVTTGYALSMQEIVFLLVEHTTHGSEFPNGMKLGQLTKAYNQITSMLASASSDMFSLTRLPIWRGNSTSGPWEEPADIALDQDRAKASIVVENEKQEVPSNALTVEEVGPQEQTPFVKVTIAVDGRPSERLAMRLDTPWSNETQRSMSKNNGIYLPEDFEFLIERAQKLEKTGDKIPLSSEDLIAFHANLILEESKIVTGRKQMSRFDSVPGVFRQYSNDGAAKHLP